MRTRSLFAVAAFCVALVLPGMAAAQSIAYATDDGYTNLRAGPSTRYPVIARVYPGSRVDVLGCLDTRAWCDVVVQDIRGWIYANRLEFVYGGRRVLVPDYYTYFGAPSVIFRFGDDDHGRRRSGYDHSRRRSGGVDHSRRRSDDDHSRRRSRDYDKSILGHPGGGGPGPEYVTPPPIEGTVGGPPDDKQIFGHPGGGGPGPEYVGPPVEGTTGGDKPIFGQPGGGPGPEYAPPLEGGPGGGPCQPGSPNCVDIIQ